jgi:peflin
MTLFVCYFSHFLVDSGSYENTFSQDSDRNGTINYSGACVFLMLVNTSSTHGWSCSTEFAGLWKYLSEWQNVFRLFDRDRSGTIEGHELAEALRSFGYTLSPQLLTLVGQKYCLYPSPICILTCSSQLGAYIIIIASQLATTIGYGPPPGISFDRFVRACVAIKTLTDAFQRWVGWWEYRDAEFIDKLNRFDTDRDGWIQINYEEFMSVSLSSVQ